MKSSYSTIKRPRNMPIGHAKANSPGSFGRNSTDTVWLVGKSALFWKSAEQS